MEQKRQRFDGNAMINCKALVIVEASLQKLASFFIHFLRTWKIDMVVRQQLDYCFVYL